MVNNRLPRLDALRTLAVLLVVLFHLDLALFELGYLGVDLFLLLSGFLMTYTMLIDRERHGTFRVGAFFLRRIRRIVPSLVIVTLICCLLALLFMTPSHLVDVAKQGLYTQLLISNVYFYGQAGYFEPANELRPLLHTWSLSLEEQFYLCFGLLLVAGKWISFRLLIFVATGVTLGITAVGALATAGYLNVSGLKNAAKLPDAMFYLLPFRAVQFLVGCSVAFLIVPGGIVESAKQSSQFARLMDMVVIALPVAGTLALVFSQDARFFSTLIVPACFAPVLLYGRMLDRVGALEPVAFVAKISYQVYLTHWPLIVFWKYWTFAEIGPAAAVILFVFSIVTGWALYLASSRLVQGGALVPRAVGAVAVMVASSFFVQFAAYATEGLTWRVPKERLAVSVRLRDGRDRENAYCFGTDLASENRRYGTRPGDPIVTCERIVAGGPRIYLFGDSHARHLLPGFSEMYPAATISVMYFTSCAPQSGIGDFKVHYNGRKALAEACAKRNRDAIRFLADQEPATVVIHQFSGDIGDIKPVWLEAAALLIDAIEKSGHKVVWMGSVPFPGKLLADCIAVPTIYSDRRLATRCQGDLKTAAETLEKNSELETRFPRQYFNVSEFFCPGGRAQNCNNTIDGVPAFRDKHHLTVEASIALVRWFRASSESSTSSSEPRP